MWLIAGLGNPGPAYKNHRHNVGFMALDIIVQRFWPMGRWRGRFHGETQEFPLDSEKIVALKPQTFMNASGNSVGEAAEFYKIPAAAVIVLHDDLDLEPGRVEVKQGGGHGGHNGLKSIDDRIGQGYWRVRLGIGHPANKLPLAAIDREKKQQLVLDHVLGNFHKDELAVISPGLDLVAEAIPLLIEGDVAGFRRQMNPQPQSAKG
jgi:PTH1 family peptidyl-tRNA hydrolase